jgi:hypothetical protein
MVYKFRVRVRLNFEASCEVTTKIFKRKKTKVKKHYVIIAVECEEDIEGLPNNETIMQLELGRVNEYGMKVAFHTYGDGEMIFVLESQTINIPLENQDFKGCTKDEIEERLAKFLEHYGWKRVDNLPIMCDADPQSFVRLNDPYEKLA